MFVLRWSLELWIFGTVTLQDGAYGDRCEGSEGVRAERALDLGRKERNELFVIYYLQQQMQIYMYIYIYIYQIISQTLLHVSVLLHHLQGVLILRLLKLCNVNKITQTVDRCV